MSADAWVGFVIDGRYRIDARVAEGGFGTVYRGFHLGLGRPVAIKILRVETQVAAQLGDGRQRLVEELRAEGATLQRLSTQTLGVVQALDVGEATSPAGDWAPYLVLEWVDGEPLGKYSARRGPMPIEEVLPLLDAAASALAVAHTAGVAHRDVKPGNILVTQIGSRTQTKLLDFGVAKVMTNEALARARAATRLSFLAFTPAWGAPEQFDPNLGHTGTWTDVYALALVVVALLIGKRPYEGNGVDLAMRALDPAVRPTPRAFGVVVPDAIERALARALAVDPRNRPSRAGELWEALVGALDPTQVSAPRGQLPAGLTVGTGQATDVMSVAPSTALDLPSPLSLFQGRPIGGDFRLLRELSRGGMGAVYVAQQLSTSKTRAIKLMHPSLVANPRLRERFEQEARVGARIPSEHVVDVIAAGVDAETAVPWLAMELLEGEDLATYAARRGPLPPHEVLDVFEQLCHAIAAGHRSGVVHRDLKPENIFLAKGRRAGAAYTVKVLDFGIAKVVAEAQANTTSNVGTPLWMAPEQADARAAIGPAADVWSLGLIAFRLLTGKSYWQSGNEEHPSSMRIISEVCFGALPQASARARELGVQAPGAAFDRWFARCVDRDPARRFGNAEELLTALRSQLGSNHPGTMPAHWKAPTEPMPDVPVRPAGETVPMPPAPPVAHTSTRSRSTRYAVWALAALSIGLIGVGIALRTNDAPRESEADELPKAAPTAKVQKPVTQKPSPKMDDPLDIPAGAVPGFGTIGAFHIGPLRTEKDYLASAKACFADGERLCSEAQWVAACSAHPSLAREIVRTSTWDDGWILRGSGSCTLRQKTDGSERYTFRCCSPAVAVRALSADRARTIAADVLAHEAALNARDAKGLAQLFAPKVDKYFLLTNTTPSAVEKSAADWFKKWPDQWNLHESCRLVDDEEETESDLPLIRCRKLTHWDGGVVVTDAAYKWRGGKLAYVNETVLRKREAP